MYLTAHTSLGSGIVTGANPEIPGTSIIGTEGGQIIPTGPTLLGYESIGGAILHVDNFHPLSDALPTSMQVDIPLDATGEVGFKNLGMPRSFTQINSVIC